MSSAASPAALSSTRLTALDAFRGIGALAIACFHIHRYGPLPVAADQIVPDVIEWVLNHGWMAVQMFLVLAGFVTAYTLRDARMTWQGFANFALRRVIRLGSPYWLVICLVMVLSIPAISWLRDTSLTEPISWRQFFASLCFMQDILGYGNLSAGMWFVCIDIQFGLLAPSMLGAAQWMAGGKPKGSMADILSLLLMFLPLAVGSLFVFSSCDKNDVWIHYFFFMPVLGMMAWWAIEERMPRAMFWAYVALLALGGFYQWRIDARALATLPPNPGDVEQQLVAHQPRVHVLEFSMCILTGMAIYWMGRFGHLTTWLSQRPLQYLGAISYSLFLIHYPVSWCVTTLGYRLTGDRPWPALGWLVLALLASIAAAHCLYRYVELPSLHLASRLKSAAAGRT